MKRSWLIAGAVAGVLSGAAVGACGSSTGAGGAGASGPSTSVTTGSKTTATGATSTTMSGPTTGPSTSSGMGGAGGALCKTPTTLHPPKADAGANTLYCPFSGVDGGPNLYCDPSTDHCCEPTMGTAACDPAATACGGTDMDWVCEDPVADCPANNDCCAVGASIGLGNPGCANFAHMMHSTACVAKGSCSNGIIMCTDSSECPAATPTCTPFGKAGNQVGGCM